MSTVSEITLAWIFTIAGGGYDATLSDGSRVRFEPPFGLTVTLPSAETTDRLQRARERPSKPYRSRRSMNALRDEAILRKQAYAHHTAATLAAEMKVSVSTMRRWLKAAA